MHSGFQISMYGEFTIQTDGHIHHIYLQIKWNKPGVYDSKSINRILHDSGIFNMFRIVVTVYARPSPFITGANIVEGGHIFTSVSVCDQDNVKRHE